MLEKRLRTAFGHTRPGSHNDRGPNSIFWEYCPVEGHCYCQSVLKGSRIQDQKRFGKASLGLEKDEMGEILLS